MHRLIGLIFPGGVLFLAGLVMTFYPEALARFESIYPFYAYILWFLAMLITWRMHDIRAMMLYVMVAVAWVTLYFPLQADAFPSLLQMLILLLPLNTLLILFFPQQGFMRPRNLIPLLLLLLQVPILYLVTLYRPGTLQSLLEQSHLIQILLPQGGLILWVFPILLVLARYLIEKEAVDSGYLWMLIAVWAGVYHLPEMQKSTLLWSAAIIILLTAILEKSYRLAYKDELTGLPARRSLNDYLRSLGSTYTIVMADIDHFKKVNDRYGHDVGDQILKMVASRMKEVPSGGKSFRYGGEEFTIVFPGKVRKEIMSTLEELLVTIATSEFIFRGAGRPKKQPKQPRSKSGAGGHRVLKVTVSMGVSDSSGESRPAEDVLKAADNALYRAKKAGRNCIRAGRV